MEEKRCQEGFSTIGETLRIIMKIYFLRKNLVVSDVLCIFASDGMLWHYTKYLKNTKQL